jgi:Tol biopolymer transport system component
MGESGIYGWEAIMKTIAMAVAAFSLTVLCGGPVLAQSGNELYQQALVKERAEGDVQGAIEIYQRIVRGFAGDRPLAAKALVQMGLCYEKLGSQEARNAYQQVVEEYVDQTESVEQARARLAALSRPPPAGEPTIQVRQLMAGSYGDAVEILGGPYPDGRHLVYIDWYTGNLAVRDLVTGDSQQITQLDNEEGYPTGAKVSPDGKLIAYQYWYSGGAAPDDASGMMLRLVGTDGSGDRFLQFVRGIVSGSWSSDSRHIAAHMHNTEIVWISVEDGSITPLKTFQFPGKFGPAMSHSPDDLFLAVEFPVEDDSARYDIALVSTAGGGMMPLVDHPADDRLIGWVPGTDAVLFISDRSGNQDLWAVHVAETGVAGTPFPVRRKIGRVDPMGFTADGSLFYSTYTLQYVKSVVPFDERSGRVLMEAAEPILGFHDGNESAWSPNGDYLALAYREESVGMEGRWFTLRVRDMSAGTERVLTRDINPATFAGPRWLPDGQSILTVGMDNEVPQEDWSKTPAGLFRIDVGTGDVSRLFDFSPDQGWWSAIGLVPTSDGEGVVYIHKGRLVLRDLESGREDELFRHPDLIKTLALSPDGSELVFGIADSTVTWAQTPHRHQGLRLMIMPSRGGEARELLTLEEPCEVRGVAWTSDGNHILFLQRDEGGTALMRVPRDGGDSERIWETDEELLTFVPSPDGRKATYMTRTNEAEIWVMENLTAALKEPPVRR